jgi:4-diphosphocytidyl-2-C-methyl-D-erythritol kinase
MYLVVFGGFCMRERKLKARAKINLGLDVLRKREDGYHELRMVMQTLLLSDEICLTRTEEPGIIVRTNRPELPTDERNLVYRAARLLITEFGLTGGIKIDLDKQIPMAAGLAGGSADAAAVLCGMNEMCGLHLSVQQLCERGVTLGADIPYCIVGGTALAEGIGERLTLLPAAPDCHVLLAKPGIDVSTGFVYGNLRADELTSHPDIDGQMEAIRRGDFAGMAALMGNVLETVTIPAHPVIRELQDEMVQLGAAAAMMSGSGPTVFGLFDDAGCAEAAYSRMHREHPDCEVFLTGFYQPER